MRVLNSCETHASGPELASSCGVRTPRTSSMAIVQEPEEENSRTSCAVVGHFDPARAPPTRKTHTHMKRHDDDHPMSLLLVVAQWLTAPDAVVLCSLPFLTPVEVLLLADGVDRHTRRTMASSHVEMWRALVRSAFPKTPYSPTTKRPAADANSARLATWKDVFRVMAARESRLLLLGDDAAGGFQQRAQIFSSSGPELIPVQFDPEQQRLRIKLRSRKLLLLLLDVSLPSKVCKDGWVLLRERVRVTRLQARVATSTADRFRTIRHKFSTLRFGREKDAPALPETEPFESHDSSGSLVLTSTHIIVQSPVFPEIVVRIGDVEVRVLPFAWICSFLSPTVANP